MLAPNYTAKKNHDGTGYDSNRARIVLAINTGPHHRLMLTEPIHRRKSRAIRSRKSQAIQVVSAFMSIYYCVVAIHVQFGSDSIVATV